MSLVREKTKTMSLKNKPPNKFPDIYVDAKDDRDRLLRFLKDVEEGMHMLFDNWNMYFYKFPALKNSYLKMWREINRDDDGQNAFKTLRLHLQDCPFEHLEQSGLTGISLETKLIECQLAKTSLYFEQEIHKELEEKIKEKSELDRFYKIITKTRWNKQQKDTMKSGSKWVDVIQILLDSILDALKVKTPIKEVFDLLSLKLKS